MAVPLRPSTLGEILDRTAQLYRENFVLFAGIAAVYAGLLLGLNLAEIGLDSTLAGLHMVRAERLLAAVSILLSVLAAFISAGLAIAANNRAVGWLSLGRAATIRDAYAAILPRAGRYLWLLTATAFVVWTPMALVYGGYLGFALSYAHVVQPFTAGNVPARVGSMAGFAIGTGIFLLLVIPAAIWAAMMTLRYALAVPASVMEGLKAREAMRRSAELGHGARGRIFVLGLLAVAIQMGLVLLTQSAFVVLQVQHHGALPAWLRAVQQVMAFFTNAFVGPIYATGLTLFYFDQRVRKEGYDIEQLMEAAGLGAAALPEAQATDGGR